MGEADVVHNICFPFTLFHINKNIFNYNLNWRNVNKFSLARQVYQYILRQSRALVAPFAYFNLHGMF